MEELNVDLNSIFVVIHKYFNYEAFDQDADRTTLKEDSTTMRNGCKMIEVETLSYEQGVGRDYETIFVCLFEFLSQRNGFPTQQPNNFCVFIRLLWGCMVLLEF